MLSDLGNSLTPRSQLVLFAQAKQRKKTKEMEKENIRLPKETPAIKRMQGFFKAHAQKKKFVKDEPVITIRSSDEVMTRDIASHCIAQSNVKKASKGVIFVVLVLLLLVLLLRSSQLMYPRFFQPSRPRMIVM